MLVVENHGLSGTTILLPELFRQFESHRAFQGTYPAPWWIRSASIFVPVVLLICCVLPGVWAALWVGGEHLVHAIAVLVICLPPRFGLAPTLIFPYGDHGRHWRGGSPWHSNPSMHTGTRTGARKVDTVIIFDQDRTLTEGAAALI